MKLVVKSEALEKNIRNNGYKYWYLSCSGAEDRILEYDGDKSFEENLKDTIDFLENDCEAGLYNFFGRKSEGASRGNFNFLVRVGGARENATVTQPVIAGYTSEDVEARIAGAIADYENRRKVEELEKELKELKEENKQYQGVRDQVMAKVLPFIEPVLSGFVSGIRGKFAPAARPAVGISGVESHEIDTDTDHDKDTDKDTDKDLLTEHEEERLYSVVEKLKKAEPEHWLTMLEKVADMADKNTENYQFARKFLI